MGTVTARATRSRGSRRVAAGLFVLVGVLLAVGVVAVVGSWGDEAQSPAEATDVLVGPDYYASAVAVCALLSPEDLSLALGYGYSQGFEPPLTYPVFLGISGLTRCTYVQDGGLSAVSIGVVYAYAEQVFEQRRDVLEERGDVTDVSGVGDEAFYGEAAGELLVLADGKVVVAQTPGTSASRDEGRIELTRRLAAKAVARLQ